jgi:hypothetical protein
MKNHEVMDEIQEIQEYEQNNRINSQHHKSNPSNPKSRKSGSSMGSKQSSCNFSNSGLMNVHNQLPSTVPMIPAIVGRPYLKDSKDNYIHKF